MNHKPILGTLLSVSLLGAGPALAQRAPQAGDTVKNSIGMEFAHIPAGTFTMGSPLTEEWRSDDEVLHEVEISHAFYLGRHEVTQSQYQKVIGTNPSDNVYSDNSKRKGDFSNYPVNNVTWKEAIEFCERLSSLPAEKNANRAYRLPTEAEWEYACRAGSKGPFCFGNNLSELKDYAWHNDRKNFPLEPRPVGLKKANKWNLFDMHGNVCEWCSDWYGEYPIAKTSDPQGPKNGTEKVNRGGCFGTVSDTSRSAIRFHNGPTFQNLSTGFRVVQVQLAKP